MDQAQFECRSCSQERQDIVNVRRFIAKLDEFFAVNDLDGASKHIEYRESEARALNDACGLISILN